MEDIAAKIRNRCYEDLARDLKQKLIVELRGRQRATHHTDKKAAVAKMPGTQLVSVSHSLHLTIQGVLSPRSVRALLAAAEGESLATRNRKNWEVLWI